MNFNHLRVRTENEVLEIQLNAPARRNTLRLAVLEELHAAIDMAKQHHKTNLVILTGVRTTFSVGADIEEIDAFCLADLREFIKRGQKVIRALISLEMPTIAAVNGVALGGGFELALACDVRWAHQRAVFTFPECKLGLIPAWGGRELLSLHVPRAARSKLLSDGDRLGALAAHELGLVSQIFAGRDFITSVREQSQRMLEQNRLNLPRLERLIHLADFEQGLRETALAFEKLWMIRQENKGGCPMDVKS